MNEIKEFKFWCQKVLPLVYDDSLSYYEVLCKVTNHLNEVINSQNVLTDNFKILNNAFNVLQNYVDNYFTNLDVQSEINNKLDSMLNDGSLIALVAEYLPFVTPEHFGAIGDGISNDTESIQRALNSGNNYVMFGGGKTYLINGLVDGYNDNMDNVGLIVPSNTTVNLNGCDIKQTGGTSSARSIIFNLNGVENVTIFGGTLIGDSDTHLFNVSGTTDEWGHGINVRKSKNVYLHDLVIKNMCGDGIYVGQSGVFTDVDNPHSYNVTIERCDINHAGRNGVSMCDCDNWLISNCSIGDVYRTAPRACIDVEREGDYTPTLKNGKIENCVFNEGSTYGVLCVANDDTLIINSCCSILRPSFASTAPTMNVTNCWGMISAVDCEVYASNCYLPSLIINDNGTVYFNNCNIDDYYSTSEGAHIYANNSKFRHWGDCRNGEYNNCLFCGVSGSSITNISANSKVVFKGCTFEKTSNDVLVGVGAFSNNFKMINCVSTKNPSNIDTFGFMVGRGDGSALQINGCWFGEAFNSLSETNVVDGCVNFN